MWKRKKGDATLYVEKGSVPFFFLDQKARHIALRPVPLKMQ